MSYIDGFDHEIIGTLGYLPIYHPLETIEGDGGWGAYDFSATPQNLVLGGGSGEHPGLVVHHLPTLAARFLLDSLTEAQAETLSSDESEYVDELYYAGETLEFCGWRIGHYARLQAMAQSPALNNPVSEEGEVEEWLERSLGELVWFSLPELNPEHQRLAAIFQRFDIFPSMRNVAVDPPGYPACGGRIVVNGALSWGHQRWRSR